MPQSHRRAALAVGATVLALTMVAAEPAAAASQRTFVSTSGVDNLACSLASPCRSFGSAITATAAGGEVIVLDSGGYGPVTITQSVSITAPSGIYAGISVSAGNGVTLATAASDTVRLSGLRINNIGTASAGIAHNSAGRLYVSDTVVSGSFTFGILFAPTASSDLIVERSALAGMAGDGITANAGLTIVARVLLDDVTVSATADRGVVLFNNSQGVIRNSRVVDCTNEGIGAFPQLASSATEVRLENSTVSHNGGHGISAGDPNGATTVTVVNSTLANNLDGVFTTNAAIVRLVGTTITRNTTGITYLAGGIAESQGNNFIHGNTADGTAPTVVGAK